MSKQLMIALVACVFGLATIAVGLYVLSQTPVPQELSAQAAPVEQAQFVVPQLDAQEGNMAGEVNIKQLSPGSEPWCEAMMVLPDSQWLDEEAKVFAQHCIYLTP